MKCYIWSVIYGYMAAKKGGERVIGSNGIVDLEQNGMYKMEVRNEEVMKRVAIIGMFRR